MEIAKQLLKSFEEHKQVGRELIKKPSKDLKWYPPPTDWINLNFDVAIKEGYTNSLPECEDTSKNCMK